MTLAVIQVKGEGTPTRMLAVEVVDCRWEKKRGVQHNAKVLGAVPFIPVSLDAKT